MSDYFTHLAARALGVAQTARPRRSIFEPRRAAVEPLVIEPEGRRAEPDAPAEAPEREAAASPSRAETPVVLPAEVREAPPAPGAERTPSRESARRRVARRALRAGQLTSLPPPEALEPEPPPKQQTPRSDTAARRRIRAPQPELPAFPVAVRTRRHVVPTTEASAPTVRVTIGRVDVRAVTPEQPSPKKKHEPKQVPRMSLDEYLGRTR